MKYIKLFEAFSKDYMKKIDLKDFKKIKIGAKLMYMGGKVEVLDNNGYVLQLKGEDDRIFMVNKSQFDHGGMTMRESVNELRSDMISGTSGRRIESLEDRKYELKKDVKGARIGDFVNVLLPKGTIIYNLPGGVFADHFSLKQKYSSRSSQGPRYFDKPTFKGISIRQMPDILAAIEKNSKVLESFDTEVNEGKIELALNKIEKWMPEDQDVQQEYYDIIDKGNVKGMEEFLDIHADEEVLKTFGIKYKDLGKLAKAAIKESVVNEGKNTIGLAFKEEQDYLDFKEFVAEQPRGAIRKNIGFDSKTKSWNVEMDVKVLDSIYGEGTSGNKESGWYGGLPDDFESVIIESVVTEAAYDSATRNELAQYIINLSNELVSAKSHNNKKEIKYLEKDIAEVKAALDKKKNESVVTEAISSAVRPFYKALNDSGNLKRYDGPKILGSRPGNTPTDELIGADKEDRILFGTKGDKFGIKSVRGINLPTKLLKLLGFVEGNSFTKGVESYGPKGDDMIYIDLNSMQELVAAFDSKTNYSVEESVVNEAKARNRAEVMDFLETKLKLVRTSEEFDGAEGGIWTSAENGETLSGSKIFDYYSESSKYEFGVLNKFAKELSKLGWYCEFYDPGTVMIWEE